MKFRFNQISFIFSEVPGGAIILSAYQDFAAELIWCHVKNEIGTTSFSNMLICSVL